MSKRCLAVQLLVQVSLCRNDLLHLSLIPKQMIEMEDAHLAWIAFVIMLIHCFTSPIKLSLKVTVDTRTVPNLGGWMILGIV